MSIVSVDRRTVGTVSFVQRHPLLSFGVLSIALGWLLLLLAAVLPYLPLILLSASAPLLAAFVVSAVRKEEFNSRALIGLPTGIEWYMVPSVPLLWAGILFALHQLFPDGTVDYPIIPILLFTTALVVIFAKSEQLAWRGYILPKLLERHSRFGASLIINALFLSIYLPLYWLGALVDTNVFPLSPAFMTGVVVFYVWLWHHLHVMGSMKQHGLGRAVVRSALRGLLALFVGLFAVLSTAYLYQTVAAELDKRTFSPPGQLVTVDGHQMHIYCTGTGSPTVILESGAFSFSSEWYAVQTQLERTNRVCSYDRAGYGWSDPVSGPRDGLVLVRELHALLQHANIPGPYVMAGHSLGGVLEVIYASQYPNEILGLVLVDSAVPTNWPDRKTYDEFVSQNQSAYVMIVGLTRLGLIRPIVNGEFQTFGYPSAIIPQLTAIKAKMQGVETWDTEVRLAQWDLYYQLQASANLGKLPVVVMWAGHPEITAQADRKRLESIWALLPTLSSNQVTRVVEGANHGSIIGGALNASQINQAILDVIKDARTGEPLK